MLFDLRSPRRRVAIKFIYGTLAVLMGGGLIFFGIGSDATGGLADIFGGNNSADTTFDDQIDDAEQQVEENPRDQQALLDLVTLNLQAGAQQAEGIDENTGYTILSSDSEDSFAQAGDAWNRYLKLQPKQPDSGVALQLANSYFLLAINADSAADAQSELGNAADAQKVAAEQNPIIGNLNSLTTYLFLAGRFAEGERAAEQTLAAASPKQRKAFEKRFDALRKQARDFQKQVDAEAKGAAAGGNPLEQPGGLGGAGGLSSP